MWLPQLNQKLPIGLIRIPLRFTTRIQAIRAQHPLEPAIWVITVTVCTQNALDIQAKRKLYTECVTGCLGTKWPLWDLILTLDLVFFSLYFPSFNWQIIFFFWDRHTLWKDHTSNLRKWNSIRHPWVSLSDHARTNRKDQHNKPSSWRQTEE